MATGSVVVDFDVFEHFLAQPFSSGKALTVDEFDFECVEEALGNSVIVAIALATHTANQPILIQLRLVGS